MSTVSMSCLLAAGRLGGGWTLHRKSIARLYPYSVRLQAWPWLVASPIRKPCRPDSGARRAIPQGRAAGARRRAPLTRPRSSGHCARADREGRPCRVQCPRSRRGARLRADERLPLFPEQGTSARRTHRPCDRRIRDATASGRPDRAAAADDRTRSARSPIAIPSCSSCSRPIASIRRPACARSTR